jgi:phosphohistidine phosphatase
MPRPQRAGHTGCVAEHTLILLRHSKSDWSGDEADIDRPLAKRGRRQAPEAGQWLATHVDRIDMAVVSTAKRARATWDLVWAELGERPETRHDEDAYAASVGELLDIIRSLDEQLGTVVLVGHNPGLEGLAETLVGDTVPLPTSALAVIELHGPWRSAGRAPGLLRAAGRPPTD